VREKVGANRAELEKRVQKHKEFNESSQNFLDWLTTAREELERWAEVTGGDKQSAEKKLNKIKVIKTVK